MKLFKWFKNFLKGLFRKKPKKRGYGYLKFVFKKNYGLTSKIEFRAIRKHNKLVKEFLKKRKKFPTKSQIGRIIINASHMTIKYRKGNTGHWERQKVRHYLFNLHRLSYIKK